MIVKELGKFSDPLDLFETISSGSKDSFLLESADGSGERARWTIFGCDPQGRVEARGDQVEVEGEIPPVKENEGAEEYIDRVVSLVRVDSPFPFPGGFVGAIAFERFSLYEPCLRGYLTPEGPDLTFSFFPDSFLHDRSSGSVYYLSLGEDRSDDFLKRSKESVRAPPSFELERETLDRSKFEEGVLEIQERILGGDAYQVVLARRIFYKGRGDPLEVYRNLRRSDPSPYMFFLRNGSRVLLGSSPEGIVRVSGESVRTYPIAGTRPTGKNPKTTEELARELLEDGKEEAEHAMLVDLARNDLGRVSVPGSVRVVEYRRLERLKRVQHLVSVVEGRLQGSLLPTQVLRALFPAGTVSGAPKIEATKILSQIERSPRGFYSGGVGYVSAAGSMDFALAIRTLVLENGRASLGCGAGIVRDSLPPREFEETEAKSRSLREAMGVVE